MDGSQADPPDGPFTGLPAASPENTGSAWQTPGTVGGAWQTPGSFGTVGRGPRLLSGGGRRATAVSTASTLVVLAALVAIFLLAPGSKQVRHVFFNPTDMWQSLIGNPKKGYYSVGEAIWLNIRMFLAAEVLILGLALFIALIRQSVSPVLFPFRVLSLIYVDFFRGVPLLLVLLAIGFGVPALRLPGVSTQSAAIYGVAALVLSYSAYVSEVYRAGLNSVHRSQTAAARSLGLSQSTTLRYVILPQAVRNIIPPLLNDFISLQKDTALVSTLGAIEANGAAQIYSSTVFNYSSYTVAAILFLILTIPLARFTDRLIDRDRRRRLAGAST
ncbi:MAG: amino acid ABC transporter permease [Streptosporangiaceae bacterium]|jgi:polar amino acid transport system permease protein